MKTTPWLAVISALVLGSVQTAPLSGQERARTFPALKCRYTLPDETWSWNDRPAPQAVFRAENTDGLTVVFAHTPLPKSGKLDDEFVEEYEAGMYGPGKFKKRDGHFLRYQGLRSYQTEGTISDEKTIVTRIFLAHGASYQLMVLAGAEPIERKPVFEKIMSGFEFTEPPAADEPTPKQPNAPPHPEAVIPPPREEPNISRLMGRIAFWCVLAIAVVAISTWVFRKLRD